MVLIYQIDVHHIINLHQLMIQIVFAKMIKIFISKKNKENLINVQSVKRRGE